MTLYCIEMSKRIFKLFRCFVNPHNLFSTSNVLAIFRQDTNEGVECRRGMKKSRFSTNVSLYLGNVQDRTIVIMKRQSELVYDVSNGAISNDLE